MTRHVLMISPHFPPDSTAATHRLRLIVPYLADHGWTPTVLTVDPGDYEGPLDPRLAESVPSDIRVVRARAWPARWTRSFGVGDLGLRAYTGLRRAAVELLSRERFDALFITMYPTYPALLGPVLKNRFGIPFVLDYQDPWVGEWGKSVGNGHGGRADFKSRLSRRLAEALEPRALGAADGVTAVSRATYEQALERTATPRPVVAEELPIGWDRRDFSFVDRASAGRVPDDDGFVHLSYVGTLLPAGFDTLRALFGALARVRATEPSARRLRLHFFGTSNQRTPAAPLRVLPIAGEFGVDDIVSEVAERLDYFDALRVLGDSDAILLLGSHERHYTPSKVFPALLSRRPVLALYHAESTVTSLLRRYGTPPAVRLVTYDSDRTVVESVDAIACHLRELAANPAPRLDAVNEDVLANSSAPALAARLATVFDRVAS